MNRKIADYIQRHRAVYTKDALRQMLLQERYDPAEIEEAFAAVEAGRVPPPGLTLRFWLIFIGYLLLLYGLPLVLFGLTPAGPFIVPILGVLLLIAAGISILVAALSRSAAVGLTSGLILVFAMPFVFLVIVAGSCLALVSPILFAPQPELPRNGTLEIEIEPPLEFEGTGLAVCYLEQSGQVYSISATDVGRLDGQTVTVYTDFSVMPTNLGIELHEGTYDSRTALVYSNGPPGTDVEVDANPDRRSGTMTFENLEGVSPGESGEPGETDRISGTIHWDCD